MTALVLVACADAEADGGAGAPPGDTVRGRVTVLAAASLTEVFGAVADEFETQHPGARVVLGFGGSSSLAQQVAAGAPADVVATASRETMEPLAADGLLHGEPVLLARNTLVIAVPAGNPGGVDDVTDLAAPDLRIALCAPEVPCGGAARRLLERAGVEARPDTLERDVRGALVKVRLGEVDAALVYRTDVAAAGGEVEAIATAGAAEASTDYLVARLRAAPNPSAAAAFAAFVQGPRARAIMADAGFDVAPAP